MGRNNVVRERSPSVDNRKSRSKCRRKKHRRHSSSTTTSSTSNDHDSDDTSQRRSRKRSTSKKISKNKKVKHKSGKRKHRSRSSSTSSSSDSSSSERERKVKKKKKRKKKKAKHKKSLERKESKSGNADIGPTLPAAKANVEDKIGPAIGPSLPRKSLKPMTQEEWEKQQSIVRRVFDPDTGRHRLVKGDGEIIEEIVSKARQREINKQATLGDGVSFQVQVGLLKKS